MTLTEGRFRSTLIQEASPRIGFLRHRFFTVTGLGSVDATPSVAVFDSTDVYRF